MSEHRPPSPFALAGALARTSVRLGARAASRTARSVERAARPLGSAVVHTGSEVVRAVADADLGVGPVRLSPRGLAWVRDELAHGLRQLLAADLDPDALLRGPEGTAFARAVLALVGGEQQVTTLPSPEQQIRHRFRALLASDDPDREGVAPALLAIVTQLSPDEARILQHLDELLEAPVVSVQAGTRTRRAGPVVAEHLTVLVERSGGEHPERGTEYVGNLLRLGLCAVDDEVPANHPDLDDITASQPFQEAIAAVRNQGARPRVQSRTLRLTALGRQLVAIALHPTEDDATGAPRVEAGPPPPPPEAVADSHQQR